VRFEVLMAVCMFMLVSWVVMPYGLVGKYVSEQHITSIFWAENGSNTFH
jgi:hypothetical protein